MTFFFHSQEVFGQDGPGLFHKNQFLSGARLQDALLQEVINLKAEMASLKVPEH
jgi:hypothetical protein